jgi:carbon storage regulator CsrA
MLVLTRKQEEKICIGNGITITVLKMKGQSVRLGIEAPKEVRVIRGELQFEEQPLPAEPNEAEPLHGDSKLVPMTKLRSSARESNWSSDSSATLQRVSRSEAEKFRGPLREMLARRDGVMGR